MKMKNRGNFNFYLMTIHHQFTNQNEIIQNPVWCLHGLLGGPCTNSVELVWTRPSWIGLVFFTELAESKVNSAGLVPNRPLNWFLCWVDTERGQLSLSQSWSIFKTLAIIVQGGPYEALKKEVGWLKNQPGRALAEGSCHSAYWGGVKQIMVYCGEKRKESFTLIQNALLHN